MTKKTSNKDKNKKEVGIEELKQQLIDAQNSSKESWEKLLRTQAEMDNLRRRNAIDISNAHKFALESFAKDILSVNDSMIMAIKTTNNKNTSIASIKEGLEMTHKVFIDILSKFNIVVIDPKVGSDFDIDMHQAITMIEDKKQKINTIVEVVQMGFKLNDRVIRPASVIVTK